MPAPLFSNADYADALHKLLPSGPAWPRQEGTTLDATLRGVATCGHRLNGDANDLLVDAFPATAVQLLPEWEETCDTDGTGSTNQRQAAVMAVLEDSGGSTRSYFHSLVLSFGFTSATINDGRGMRVNDPVNSRMYGVAQAFRWNIVATGGGSHADAAGMIAAVNKFKPAHTVVKISAAP